jgi:hypothetical protein
MAKCGEYANQARVSDMFFISVIVALLLFAKYFFIAIGYEQDIAEQAQIYINWSLPCLYQFA